MQVMCMRVPISPDDSPLANGVEVDDREIHVTLNDGRILHVPIGISRRLAEAQPDQRMRYRLIAHGIGINWPDVDEDLSVRGLVPAATRVCMQCACNCYHVTKVAWY